MTLAVPGDNTRLAGTAASRRPALTNVVVRFEPFHRTVIVLVKFEPSTWRVNPGDPALAELGFRLVITGDGLMTKFRVLAEFTPSCVKTLTGTVPGVPIRAVETDAVAVVNPQ